MKKIEKSDAQWKKELTPEQYNILRQKGTEAPNTGKYVHWDGKGDFVCAACGNVLFSSGTKFDSCTGWPSFSDVVQAQSVELHKDDSHGMDRIEVTCKKCGGHLGHVFDDGPGPTGKRYCINSAALRFEGKKKN